MKYEKVGIYELLVIFTCKFCHQNTVEPSSLPQNDGTKAEFSYYPPTEWTCSGCEEENDVLPSYCKKFTCPDCNKLNFQINEPSEIKDEDHNKLFIHNSIDVTCMHCDSAFIIGVFVGNGDETQNILLRESPTGTIERTVPRLPESNN